MAEYQVIMTAQEIHEAIEVFAQKLVQQHGDCQQLALVGIQRRGVDLANRLCARMEAITGKKITKGSLDIALYRDDWTTKAIKPEILETSILFDVEGKKLVLVDDVLYTGRTIRAALEALADFGRPSKVELLVLVDRGHRELPIHADYVGLAQKTDVTDRVDVLVTERDNVDEVRLVRGA